MMTALLDSGGEDGLVNWADPNGITFPILDDNQSLLANRWGVSGIPSYTLIGRDMTYVVVNGYASPSQIEAALDEPVPEVEWDMPPPLEPGDSAEPGDVEDSEQEGSSEGTSETYAGPWGGGPAPADAAGVASPYGGCSADVAQAPEGAAGFGLALLGLFGLWRRRQS